MWIFSDNPAIMPLDIYPNDLKTYVPIKTCNVNVFSTFIEVKWSCSVVSDSATPQTVAYRAAPSIGFSRPEHWSGLPSPKTGGN